MPRTRTPNHHGSHQRLVWPADGPVPWARVDAIIVPTTRQAAYLKEAARAARHLGCTLVTLHSGKWTRAIDAVRSIDRRVDLIAIDVPDPAHLRLPDLETTRLLAGTVFEQRSDLSAKRNLGLMLSHMLGWERVVFLDDDIRVPDPADLTKAAGLLDTHAAAGLHVGGYPDNSVVCHAFRDAGGDQGTFVGGGAMAVEVKRNHSFFPKIYNEDWFYLLDAGKRLRSVATVGEVLQYPYDPYRVERARAQELGDVLAEGLFWLLDQGKAALDGDLEHWRGFLAKRRLFIEQILAMVGRSANIQPAERALMIEALKAALGRLAHITPELCVDYLRALVSDQERWRRHIQGLQRQPRDRAVRSLARRGATPLTWYTRPAAFAADDSPARPRPKPAPQLREPQPGELLASSQASPRALMSAGVPVTAGASPNDIGPAGASHAAHALVSADVVPAGQEGQADRDDYGDKHPSQQLHA